MIRKGILFASLFLATFSVVDRLSYTEKRIEVRNIVKAFEILSSWTSKQKSSKIKIVKRQGTTPNRVKAKRITTISNDEIVKVKKVFITENRVEFKNLVTDTVSRKAYARRRSIIRPLTLELKTVGEKIQKKIEFSNPIEKKIEIEEKELRIKNKQRVEKEETVIEEIKNYEIVKSERIEINKIEKIQIASLLESVEIERGMKFVAFIESEKKNEEQLLTKKMEQKVVEDKVETKLAASIKIDDVDSFPLDELNARLKEEKINLNEHAEEEKKIVQIPVSSEISDNVAEVINRELEKPLSAQRVVSSHVNNAIASFNIDNDRNDDDDRREYSRCEAGKKIEIFAYETGKEDLSNFEITPAYDENSPHERIEASGGVISMCKDVPNEYSVMPVLVRHEGMVATSAVISFSERHGQINVPMISAERMETLRREYSVDESMGAILVEMYGNIDDVDVDSSQKIRIDLNESFEEIQEQSERVAFVLFLNVEPRNNVIWYQFGKGRNRTIVDKIVFVGPSEVFYDDPDFREGGLEKIELVQRNVVGTISTELDIYGKDLGLFGQNVGVNKIGLNRYEYVLPRIPVKMRKYIELKHLDRSVFAGYGEQSLIEIPSGEYVEYSLSKLGIDPAMELQCAIQVNISPDRSLLGAKVGGRDSRGAMYLNVIYQDKDGNYYSEPSDTTVKVLVGAELARYSRESVATGTIGMKLEYANGSSDYLQSFCSDKTYLVEQL